MKKKEKSCKDCLNKVEEITRLRGIIGKGDTKDRELRGQFSSLLNSSSHYLRRNFDYEAYTWEEIFFKMGELNSDADYAILIERQRQLEEEIKNLKEAK